MKDRLSLKKIVLNNVLEKRILVLHAMLLKILAKYGIEKDIL